MMLTQELTVFPVFCYFKLLNVITTFNFIFNDFILCNFALLTTDPAQ